MVKIVLILTISASFLFSKVNLLKNLTNYQKLVIKEVYNVGKTVKTNDGMTFEKTLVGIVLTESSAGLNLIGDDFDYKTKSKATLIKSSLGAFQMKVSTVKDMIKKYPKAFEHLKNKTDRELINLLLRNYKDSAKLAGYYLKYNYERKSKFKVFKSRYFRSVSNYNGGNHNEVYYNKVIKRVREVNFLLKTSSFLN
jgi:hypothetical protein